MESAFVHSLSWGRARIDEKDLAEVRESVLKSLDKIAAVKATSSLNHEEVDGKGSVVDHTTAHPPTINPEELRNSALLGHLIRLANEGKLGWRNQINRSKIAHDNSDSNLPDSDGSYAFGKISDSMKSEMELGFDDQKDEVAVESLSLMKNDEKNWFE